MWCFTFGLLRMATHWSMPLGFGGGLSWTASDFSSSSSPTTKIVFGTVSAGRADTGLITSSRETRWSWISLCYISSSSKTSPIDTPISALLPVAGTVMMGEGLRDRRASVSFLQQVSVSCRRVRVGADIVMGFFSDRVDSISTCSKKMYLIANSRAKARQITCSMSMVIILQGWRNKNILLKQRFDLKVLINGLLTKM